MEMLRMTQDEHSMLQFDANDYRALRIEELRLSALTAAEKVKKSHLPFHFSPMNSRERRIIHLALRNDSGVRSESVRNGSQAARWSCIRRTCHRCQVVMPARPRPRGRRR